MAERLRQRVVRFLKIALPLSAFALIAAIFAFPRPDFGERIGFSDLDLSLRDGLRVSAPRFTGADAEGRPFVVTAEWARPDRPDPERVTLGPVEGEIALAADRRLSLAAAGGDIFPKDDRLTLEGGVRLDATGGWRLDVARAEIDIGDAALEAEGPVRGEGPGGVIEAAKMRAARRPDGDYIWFEGGVRVRIDPAAARQAEQDGR